MFIKSDMFDKLLCCRRKVVEEDEDERVVEEVVLQHTNNNKTEYISSAQLVEVIYDPRLVSGYFSVGRTPPFPLCTSPLGVILPLTVLCSLTPSPTLSYRYSPPHPLLYIKLPIPLPISLKHILW